MGALAAMTMTDDPKYPIYAVRWETPGLDTVSFHNRILRIQSELGAARVEWQWRTRNAAIERDAGHAAGKMVVEHLYEETWCMTWFQHETFRCPEIPDAAAALLSFSSYVIRTERRCPPDWGFEMQQRYRKDPRHQPWICMMGAEDRWRWCGENAGDGDPPCECKNCVTLGLWRIGH